MQPATTSTAPGQCQRHPEANSMAANAPQKLDACLYLAARSQAQLSAAAPPNERLEVSTSCSFFLLLFFREA